MSQQRQSTLGVTLRRHHANVPWGIRIAGGADLGTPIVITRVQSGSPAEKCVSIGDVIVKIEDYDGRDISHQDAMRLFLDAGLAVKLEVKRDPRFRTSQCQDREFQIISTEDSRNDAASRNVVFPPPNPSYSNINLGLHGGSNRREEQETSECILKQPYRTTPLVLPGAKAKHEKELAPTHSYLRHHPNPTIRSAPPQYDLLPQEVAMKQKVADSVLQKIAGDEAFAGKQVVHMQFNSPIGLYSNQNIVDTIHHQTGINRGVAKGPLVSRASMKSSAPRKTIAYDPSKSETFRALQEEQYGSQPVQEVLAPAQPKVFAPNLYAKKVHQHQPPQTHTYDPLSRSTSSPSLQHHVPYVNSMGQSEERIAQSGSFKRLMTLVMTDSEY